MCSWLARNPSFHQAFAKNPSSYFHNPVIWHPNKCADLISWHGGWWGTVCICKMYSVEFFHGTLPLVLTQCAAKTFVRTIKRPMRWARGDDDDSKMSHLTCDAQGLLLFPIHLDYKGFRMSFNTDTSKNNCTSVDIGDISSITLWFLFYGYHKSHYLFGWNIWISCNCLFIKISVKDYIATQNSRERDSTCVPDVALAVGKKIPLTPMRMEKHVLRGNGVVAACVTSGKENTLQPNVSWR